jgi:hypothetical protein
MQRKKPLWELSLLSHAHALSGGHTGSTESIAKANTQTRRAVTALYCKGDRLIVGDNMGALLAFNIRNLL